MGEDQDLRLRAVFHQAVDLAEGKRARYLDEELGEDAAGRGQVEDWIHEFETLFERVEDRSVTDAVSELDRASAHSVPRDRILDLLRARDRLRHLIPAAPSTPGRIPTHLGRYRIEKELGRGGMGQVYLAFDRELQRHVAIKFLPDEFARDPERLALFEREARTAASLNHPNVATVHELGEHGGQRFIVMEFVRGGPLSDVIEEGPIPVEQLLDFALQITRGLEVAHEQSIVHRDLKPGNIMVTDESYIKILDFGLAKALQSPLAPTTLDRGALGRWSSSGSAPSDSNTRTGVFLGTPGYSSPEQTRGAAVDARTDLFSLGVVLYEMATGSSPFRRSSSAAETIDAVQNYDPPPVSAKNTDIPADLEAIINQLIEKSPAERYTTSAQVGKDLERVHERLTAPRTYTKALAIAVPLVAAAVFVITWLNLDPRAVIAFEEGLAKLEQHNDDKKFSDAKRQWTLLEEELKKQRSEYPELEQFAPRLDAERSELRAAIDQQLENDLARLKAAVTERDADKPQDILADMQALEKDSPPDGSGEDSVERGVRYSRDLARLGAHEQQFQAQMRALPEQRDHAATLATIESLDTNEFAPENFDLVAGATRRNKQQLRDVLAGFSTPDSIEEIAELRDTLGRLDRDHPRLAEFQSAELEMRHDRAKSMGWQNAGPALEVMQGIDRDSPHTRALEDWIAKEQREYEFDRVAREDFASRNPERLRETIDRVRPSLPSDSLLLGVWSGAHDWLAGLVETANGASAPRALLELDHFQTDALSADLLEDAERHLAWARDLLRPRAEASIAAQVATAIGERDPTRARAPLAGLDAHLQSALEPWERRAEALTDDVRLAEQLEGDLQELERYLNSGLAADETAARNTWQDIAALLDERLSLLAELDGPKNRLEEARVHNLLGAAEPAVTAAQGALVGGLSPEDEAAAHVAWARARILGSKGDRAKLNAARELLEQVPASSGSNTRAQYLNGYCLTRVSRAFDAKRHLEEARAVYPHAGVLLAGIYFEERRHADVIPVLEKARTGRLCIFQAQIIFGSIPEALAAPRRTGYSCDALVMRARAELQQENYSEAGEALRSALRIAAPADPVNARIEFVIDAAYQRFLDRVSDPDPVAHAQLLAAAEQIYHELLRPVWQAQKRRLTQDLEKNRRAVDLYVARGRTMLRLDDFQGALADARSALQRKSSPDAHLLACAAEYALGQSESARSHAAQADLKGARGALARRIRFWRGLCTQTTMGIRPGANPSGGATDIASCQSDLRAVSDCRVARYQGMLLDLSLENWQGAVEQATQALAEGLTPDGVVALRGHQVVLGKDRWKKRRGEILVWRGYAHVMAGKFAECIADCDEAIALEPQDAFALLHKGHALGIQALERRESLEEAEETLRKVFRAAGNGRYPEDEEELKATAERLRQAFRKKERQW